jgi:Zn-finger nucleic acid-binding protein
MLCPTCKIELSKAILHNVEIDYCSKCLGLWFEEDELRLTKDNKDKNINWLDIDLWQNESKFKIACCQKICSECRVPLYEVKYGDSDIKIDVCNLCQGIWLDRGEFKKIITYLKKKADYEVLNNYAKNLAKEFWEVFTGPETLKEEVSDLLTVLKLLNYRFAIKYPKITEIISGLPK